MEVPDVLVVTKADLGRVASRALADLRAALRSLGASDTEVVTRLLGRAARRDRRARRRARRAPCRARPDRAPRARPPPARARRLRRRVRRPRPAGARRAPPGGAMAGRAGRGPRRAGARRRARGAGGRQQLKPSSRAERARRAAPFGTIAPECRRSCCPRRRWSTARPHCERGAIQTSTRSSPPVRTRRSCAGRAYLSRTARSTRRPTCSSVTTRPMPAPRRRSRSFRVRTGPAARIDLDPAGCVGAPARRGRLLARARGARARPCDSRAETDLELGFRRARARAHRSAGRDRQPALPAGRRASGVHA